MQVRVVRDIRPEDGCTNIACDFDINGRVASLVRVSSNEVNVEIDGSTHALPGRWANYVKRVKWFGNSEVILWPVSDSTGHESHVGRLSSLGSSIIDIGSPLNIYSDKLHLVCTYPEDQITVGADISSQSDLIAIFSGPELHKIARFIEPFMDGHQGAQFLEVEQAVFDSEAKRFWFTAYKTTDIWCFSFEPQDVFVCHLGCAREEVVAISCNQETAFVFCHRPEGLFIRTYIRAAGKIFFNTESRAAAPPDLGDLISEASQWGYGSVLGYTNRRLAITTSKRALLIDFI